MQIGRLPVTKGFLGQWQWPAHTMGGLETSPTLPLSLIHGLPPSIPYPWTVFHRVTANCFNDKFSGGEEKETIESSCFELSHNNSNLFNILRQNSTNETQIETQI